MRRLFLVAALVLLGLGCKKSHGPARCYGQLDCDSDEACVRLASSAQTCVHRCDRSTEFTCTGGEACVGIPGEDASVDVCLPGGVVALGAACETSSECVLGAVCLTRPPRTDAVCEKLCTVGEPNLCGDVETCVAIDGATSATRGSCTTP